MAKPRILYLDIETAPAKAYIWDLKTRFVPLEQVAEDGYILCFAAAWAGEDHCWFSSRWEHGHDAMIQEAWNLLDEAEIVIHYNGSKFDIPRLQTEFLVSDMHPPSSYQQIDLYRTVAGSFKVLSKSMNHMLKLLSLDEKMAHKGMSLWTGVMADNKEDQQTMMDYNIQDVVVMEDLYKALTPWIKNHPNLGLWIDPDAPTCRNCGSQHVKMNGIERTTLLPYQRYKCQDCGTNLKGRYRLKSSGDGVLR